MSELILNKKLSKASGVILIRDGKIVDFFEKATVVDGREIGHYRGFGFVEMSSKEEVKEVIGEHYKLFENDTTVTEYDEPEEAELNSVLKDFKVRTKSIYRKIDASQKEVEKLNDKSAKRQKRFEVAMQKLDGMFK